jgi:hypothetical protein
VLSIASIGLGLVLVSVQRKLEIIISQESDLSTSKVSDATTKVYAVVPARFLAMFIC